MDTRKTTKGKSIDYLENTVSCHYRFIPDDKLEESINSLEDGSMIMRTTFNKTIFELAKINNKIYLVLADIGYGEIEPCRKFPGRYYNVE